MGLHRLPECLIDYRNYLLNKKNRSNHTIVNYTCDLVMLLRYLKKKKYTPHVNLQKIRIDDIDNKFLQNITEDDLNKYVDFLADVRGNVARARARKITSVTMFFKYLHRKKHILKENVAEILEKPKFPKTYPIYLNEEEINKLLDAVYESGNIQHICIITLFVNLGIRLSELVDINFEHIKGNKLKVVGKGMKQRNLFLNTDCINTINEYLKIRHIIQVKEEDKNALFVSTQKKRIGHVTVENIVKKYLKLAGLNDKLNHTHTLRHSYLTMMCKNGVDIMQLAGIAGHESISTTQIYIHMVDEDIKNAMLNNNPLSNRKRTIMTK